MTGFTLLGGIEGAYYINLRDTAEVPSWTLPTLTYHEAAPGHHLQISLQQESEAAPKYMNLLGFSSYVEGWGLYAEQLADELGAYENDPIGQIGYVQSLMFRAARLVVDTGIHAMGWSRDKAIAYMIEQTGHDPVFMTAEVDRYASQPGQALSYMMGLLKLKELRARAEAALGPKFDQRRFHNALIDQGAMPLPLLEQRINSWIASEKGRA